MLRQIMLWHIRKRSSMKNFSFNFVKPNSKIISNRANLINCWEEDVKLTLGKETDEGGVYALKSLTAAVYALKKVMLTFWLRLQ